MSEPIEFSRPVRIDTIGAGARQIEVTAEAEERALLAKRFALQAIDSLTASLSMARNGDIVMAEGRLQAQVTQSCVASGAPVAASVDTPFRIQFTPPPDPAAAEEVELSESDCDTIFYEGSAIDVGEAVAETLALSLDPWPRAPDAEEVLKKAGVKSEAEAGPFAALAALKDKLGK